MNVTGFGRAPGLLFGGARVVRPDLMEPYAWHDATLHAQRRERYEGRSRILTACVAAPRVVTRRLWGAWSTCATPQPVAQLHTRSDTNRAHVQ